MIKGISFFISSFYLIYSGTKRCIVYSKRNEDSTWNIGITDLRKVWVKKKKKKNAQKNLKFKNKGKKS